MLLSLIAVVFISGTMYIEGSPGGKTGSPLDGITCAQCHPSSVTPVEWISSNIPVTGYMPGQTYIITINATDASATKIGFEVTAENASEKQGVITINDKVNTQLTNNNEAITHQETGTTPRDGKISWNFNWTAPVTDKGDVTFYGAFNAANGNGNTSDDRIFTNSLKVSENKINKVTLKN